MPDNVFFYAFMFVFLCTFVYFAIKVGVAFLILLAALFGTV